MKNLDEEVRELLAAENALGVMKGRVQRRFRRLADGDADLRGKVARWERQLNSLCEGAPAVDAPDQVWSNIERRLQRAAGLQRKEEKAAPEAETPEPETPEPETPDEVFADSTVALDPSQAPADAVDSAALEPDEPSPLQPSLDLLQQPDLQPAPDDLDPGGAGEDDALIETVAPAEPTGDRAPQARSAGHVVADALSALKGKILERPSIARRERRAAAAALASAPPLEGPPPDRASDSPLNPGDGAVRRIREDLGVNEEAGSAPYADDGSPQEAPVQDAAALVIPPPTDEAVLLTEISSGDGVPADVAVAEERPPEDQEPVESATAVKPMAPPRRRRIVADSERDMEDDLPPWPPQGGASGGAEGGSQSSSAADDAAPEPSRRRRRRRKDRANREGGTPSGTGALRFWQAFAVIAGLLAVGLAIYIVMYGSGGPGGSGAAVESSLAPTPEAPTFVVPSLGPAAVLNGSRGEPVWLVHASGDGEIVEVHRLAQVELPLDQSLELWLLRGANAPPLSLGVLARAGGTRITLPEEMADAVSSGEAFAVSVEPAGGSTTGAISGPIVQSGAIYHVR